MRESSIPFAVAVVAAPILKLCSLKFLASTPVAISASPSFAANLGRENGEPSEHRKSGPDALPLAAK